MGRQSLVDSLDWVCANESLGDQSSRGSQTRHQRGESGTKRELQKAMEGFFWVLNWNVEDKRPKSNITEEKINILEEHSKRKDTKWNRKKKEFKNRASGSYGPLSGLLLQVFYLVPFWSLRRVRPGWKPIRAAVRRPSDFSYLEGVHIRVRTFWQSYAWCHPGVCRSSFVFKMI